MAITPNPMMPAEGEMTDQDRKADLQNDFAKLDNLQTDVKANQAKVTAEAAAGKEGVVKDVFEMMLDQGVDPSKPEQVTAFLEKLNKEDPALLELFMSAFERLTGGAMGQGMPGAAPGGSATPPPMPGMPGMPGAAPGVGLPGIPGAPMGKAMPPRPGAAMPPRPGAAMPPITGAGMGMGPRDGSRPGAGMATPPAPSPMKKFNNLGQAPMAQPPMR